jgi:hypothetical protein
MRNNDDNDNGTMISFQKVPPIPVITPICPNRSFSVPMLGVGATSWRENDDASMMPQQKQAGGLAF